MIRLYIIEDHLTVMLSSWRFLFRPKRDGITVAGFASDVDKAITEANPSDFDIFILDLYIPGYRPVENIRKLKEKFHDKPVIVYTYEKSSSWKMKMIREGASAYITKDATRDELKLILKKVSKGELNNILFTGDLDNIMMSDNISGYTNILTPIQLRIVKLLSDGHTHKEISNRSGISRSLVEKILKNIRGAFRVKNNVELIKLLSKKGSI